MFTPANFNKFCCFVIFFSFMFASKCLACVAMHANGQLVQVRQVNGPSPFWAHAMLAADGWPTITYGPIFYTLPPLMQEFTRYHECAHLAMRTQDEYQANCAALKELMSRGASQQELAFVERFHMDIGLLPPQYGGSGAAFWQGTVGICR